MKLINRTLRSAKRKPWQRRRVRPLPREVMLLDRLPLAQIDIYDDCVVLVRRERTGAWRSYPVSPEALVQALSHLPTSAGLLPDGTIGAGLLDGDPFYVQHIRARAARLQVDEGGKTTIYHLELPPLIWAGWRNEYRIFALGTPSSVTAESRLYHAPLSNVFSTGGICWGSVRVARATPTTMPQMLKTFLEESLFNAHVDNGKSRAEPASVLVQLRKLAKHGPQVPYPLDDLVATSRTLGAVLDGSVWRRR